MINRTDIAAHLDRSVRVGFLNSQKAYAPIRSPFCGVAPSDGSFESYADMGDRPWPIQNAGQLGSQGQSPSGHSEVTGAVGGGRMITTVGANERGEIVYNVDWEIAFGITHNAIDDDRTATVLQWAEGTGSGFEKHKDFLAFDALTQGINTTPYGKAYDGLSFFNASHIDPRAQYQTAQSNRNALALTLDNYETVHVAGASFLNDRGIPQGFSHDLLIVPPSRQRIGAQIVGNPQDYATANRAVNPYAAKAQMLVAPGGWLGTTSWYLVDDSEASKPLYIQDRKQPQLIIWDDNNTQEGGTRFYKWHSRYTIFYGSWRLALQGSN